MLGDLVLGTEKKHYARCGAGERLGMGLWHKVTLCRGSLFKPLCVCARVSVCVLEGGIKDS